MICIVRSAWKSLANLTTRQPNEEPTVIWETPISFWASLKRQLNITSKVWRRRRRSREFPFIIRFFLFPSLSELLTSIIFLVKWRQTLKLAQEIGDRAVEAQACYSLGNTYTLLRDYPTAIEYHLHHLSIAQELMDKIGEARACWSLGNAHSATGNHEKALHYANRHLQLSKEVGTILKDENQSGVRPRQTCRL